MMQTIVKEKQQKLLGRMRIMGLRESVYWLTWLFAYCAMGLVASLIAGKTNIVFFFFLVLFCRLCCCLSCFESCIVLLTLLC